MYEVVSIRDNGDEFVVADEIEDAAKADEMADAFEQYYGFIYEVRKMEG